MPDRFDQFSERARRVLTNAQEAAARRHQFYICPEHLALGVIRESTGVGAKVLQSLVGSLDELRGEIETVLAQGSHVEPGTVGLTPSAKKVIEFAVDEARRLNHYYIGTEHLLLGLIREGVGIPTDMLSRHQINLDRVRAEVVRFLAGSGRASAAAGTGTGGGKDSPDTFTQGTLRPLTARAQKVLVLAQEEAQRINHNYIGTEHLLLGLIREYDGIGALVLASLGVGLDRVRSAVEFIIGRGSSPVLGEIGLTPRAKKVIHLAGDEAHRLQHDYVGTEHLLLGLVREGQGIAAGVLESLGVSLDRVRVATIAVLRGAATGTGGWLAPGLTTYALPATEPSPATLGELGRVFPIAATGRVGDTVLTFLSLETYDHGFLVNGRLVRPTSLEPPYRAEAALKVTDNRGTEYEARSSTGHGNADEWRFTLCFAPSLDPTSNELQIEVIGIRWQQRDEPSESLKTTKVDQGPWTTNVPLPRT